MDIDVMCRYYVDLVRCVYILVSDPDSCLEEHVRKLFSYTFVEHEDNMSLD